MNQARVLRLAAEGHVEVTKKLLRRCGRQERSVSMLTQTLAKSELKDENVLAYPDFTFKMGLPSKERDLDLVCVQTPDGRTVRIVALIERMKTKKGRSKS